MKLTIHSDNQTRVINLYSTFFTNELKYDRGKKIIITPTAKAKMISNDLFGSKLKGFILEKDGEPYYDSFEVNRERKEDSRAVNPIRDSLEDKRHKVKGSAPVVPHHRGPKGKISFKAKSDHRT